MTIFDVLTLIGGLCLFLFGMNLMGSALERRAGDKLRDLLSTLTTNKIAGLEINLNRRFSVCIRAYTLRRNRRKRKRCSSNTRLVEARGIEPLSENLFI